MEKLAAGEIVEIEIDLLPIGLAFHPGEQLRFVISSRNLLGTLMPDIREYVGVPGSPARDCTGRGLISAGADLTGRRRYGGRGRDYGGHR